jgi:hypothetical protein
MSPLAKALRDPGCLGPSVIAESIQALTNERIGLQIGAVTSGKLASNALFWHEYMMMITRLTIVIWISTFGLVSCATFQTSVDRPASLYELQIDPVACTEISLRDDVRITKEVIHEPSIMLNRYLIVLRYRTGGDEKQFTSDLGAGYNNVSLVSEVAIGTDNPLIVFRRYCVIEMWKLVPEKHVKYCYLWTIGDDSTNMKVMLEGMGGEFLDERIISLHVSDIAKLKAFSMQLTKTMVEMLKEPAPDT